LVVQGESDMDIETVHSIAPRAKLVYFNIWHVGWNLPAALAIVNKLYPGAIYSMSFGGCERVISTTDLKINDAALAASESRGTTAFASSGDQGGAECAQYANTSLFQGQGVAWPADLPHMTSTGGTALSVDSSDNYVGETTWSEPILAQGSGGGLSRLARPTWQTGPGQLSGSHREVPDVAADADPATSPVVVINGKYQPGGGTSQSAPIWAGLTALMDNYLTAQNYQPIGFANPGLYAIAAATSGSSTPAFHEVTAGGNDFFLAGPDYNLITGLGSPNVTNLVQALVAYQKGARG
jgi:kumamolisin